MKFIFSVFSSIILLGACCSLSNRKCEQSNYFANFNIISSTTGNNLLFGASKIFNPDSLKLFSISGIDTVFHTIKPGTFTGLPQDSLLFVTFDYGKFENIYLRLSNNDIDTLNVIYEVINESSCCDQFTTSNPISYNGFSIQKNSQNIYQLRK